MDIIAHGLWGSLAFGRQSRKDYAASFLLGMGPDLCAFGPVTIGWAIRGFPHMHRVPGEPPDPSLIPSYVYSLYNISHSLVVWAAMFAIIWMLIGRPPWVFCAWMLHILCDIPTHTKRFFPTPYLWPFHTPFVNGISWGTRWFMIANYSAIILAYLIWAWSS